MDVNQLKYVVGKVEANQPAIIRFFGAVDGWNVEDFNDEFIWLQECVRPSKIIVMINSEGGSVIEGMGVFGLIQNCDIETDCIIEGIAASMGSVIWAAGDNLYMHDYSLLMIHNPFCEGVMNNDDPKTKQLVQAFKSQISMVYQKRFGLSKEEVEKIMDGKEQEDGTFFTADEAVKAGILSKDHIIKTSECIRNEIKNQIEGIEDKGQLWNIMSSIVNKMDENKLIAEISSITKKDNDKTQNHLTITMDSEMKMFLAQLGLTETESPKVSARISQLISEEKELTGTKNQLAEANEKLKTVNDQVTQLDIKLKAKDTEIANIKEDLSKANASLKVYQEAEEKAFDEKVNAMVQDAINAGKIEANSKDEWVEMAHKNFDTVKAALESIHGREDVIDKISNDKENKDHIKATMDTVEKKTAEKVKEVVGDLKLEKF